MFQDVDVKDQIKMYLNFDVNILKHDFSVEHHNIANFLKPGLTNVKLATILVWLVCLHEIFWKHILDYTLHH